MTRYLPLTTFLLVWLSVAPTLPLPASTDTQDSQKWGIYHALIIGISQYQNQPPLPTAAKDATAIRDTLVSLYGFNPKNVILRTDAEATRSQIRSDLRRLATTLGKHDNLLVYYAGYGQFDDLTGEGYWLPADGEPENPGTWLANTHVNALLGSPKMRAKNVVIIADSIFSGALLASGPDLMTLSDPQYHDKLRRIAPLSSRQVFTSGQVKPLALKGYNGFSPFAFYLIKALKENHHNAVDLENLYFERMFKYLMALDAGRPNLARLKSPNDESGHFVLVRGKATPETPSAAITANAGDSVYFQPDSVALLPASQALLLKKADTFRDPAVERIILEGHADDGESAAENLAIGDRRAVTVRDFLHDAGVPPHKITTISYGDTRAAATEAGSEKNRRVAIIVEKMTSAQKPVNPNTSASFDDGAKAYQEKDYGAALAIWEPLARRGEARAQYKMGEMYLGGKGVQPDPKEAAEWFWMAAKQGHPQAMINLGELYEQGQGVKKDLDEARRYYQKAADAGALMARRRLEALDKAPKTPLRSFDDGMDAYWKKDYATALSIWKPLAKQGDVRAQDNLGELYLEGKGVESSPEEAARWYSMAARQGNVHAQIQLGSLYESGRGVGQDMETARFWYQSAANKGATIAKRRLKSIDESNFFSSLTGVWRVRHYFSESCNKIYTNWPEKVGNVNVDGDVFEGRLREDVSGFYENIKGRFLSEKDVQLIEKWKTRDGKIYRDTEGFVMVFEYLEDKSCHSVVITSDMDSRKFWDGERMTLREKLGHTEMQGVQAQPAEIRKKREIAERRAQERRTREKRRRERERRDAQRRQRIAEQAAREEAERRQREAELKAVTDNLARTITSVLQAQQQARTQQQAQRQRRMAQQRSKLQAKRDYERRKAEWERQQKQWSNSRAPAKKWRDATGCLSTKIQGNSRLMCNKCNFKIFYRFCFDDPKHYFACGKRNAGADAVGPNNCALLSVPFVGPSTGTVRYTWCEFGCHPSDPWSVR